MANARSDSQYEVLSPWADADPVVPRGLTPRLTDLAGRKIGLLHNVKRAARPMLAAVEALLKERFPGLRTEWFGMQFMSVSSDEPPENRTRFEEWIKDVDAVVLAVGD